MVLGMCALAVLKRVNTLHLVARSECYARDDTERMVFLDGAATDAAEQTLLHSATEANDSDLGRRLRKCYA